MDITIDCNSRENDRSNQRDRVNRLYGTILSIVCSLGWCRWGVAARVWLEDNSFPLLLLATTLKYFSTLKS